MNNSNLDEKKEETGFEDIDEGIREIVGMLEGTKRVADGLMQKYEKAKQKYNEEKQKNEEWEQLTETYWDVMFPALEDDTYDEVIRNGEEVIQEPIDTENSGNPLGNLELNDLTEFKRDVYNLLEEEGYNKEEAADELDTNLAAVTKAQNSIESEFDYRPGS